MNGYRRSRIKSSFHALPLSLSLFFVFFVWGFNLGKKIKFLVWVGGWL